VSFLLKKSLCELNVMNTGWSRRPGVPWSTACDRERQSILHGSDWVQLHATDYRPHRQIDRNPLQQ